MKQFRAKILSNQKIAPDHYVLSFKNPKIAKETHPGQFFNIKVSDSCGPLLRRPFGAHKINKGTIEILYKVVGKATAILSSRIKGSSLDILGPLGNGFDMSFPPRVIPAKAGIYARGKLQRESILVAGGHGVAPLYALAESISKATVLIGAKTKAHVVCEKDFKKLGCKVRVATEDGTKGYKGLITDLLKKNINRQTGKPASRLTIYACGPKPMLKEVARLVFRHDIPCQVSLEEYVACGIGTCLGCAIKVRGGYKLICKDGPVFDAEEVVWD